MCTTFLAKMKDPNAFYDVHITTKNSKALEMEDLEGFVTIKMGIIRDL
jgi:hypothetical protein